MADTVTKAGWDAGAVVATDDVGGTHYPIGKLAYGPLDTATLVSKNDALPVGFYTDASDIDTTTTPLAGSATYTSPTYDTTLVGPYVNHFMYASHDGTHIHEESVNGTDWDIVDQDPYLAGNVFFEEHYVCARYHRTRFVNDATLQTAFRHQVICRHIGAQHAIGLRAGDNIVQGNKTHNTTAPSALAHEVIGAIAKAAAPTYSEGAVVMPRVTLSGDQAVTLDGEVVSVTGTFWQSTQPVSVTSVPTHDVTNAGTFAVQATLAAETTKVIGTVNVSAGQTIGLAAGTANIGDVDVLTVPAPLNVTGNGLASTAMRVTLASDTTGIVGLAAGTANIGDVDILTVPAPLSTTGNGTAATALRVTIANDSTGVASVTGNISHDNPDSGNPIKTGGIARTANPTAVAALDRVDSFYDLEGRQVVQPFGPRALTVHNTITLTTTSETTLITAGAAGIFHDVLGIFVANSSATAVAVTIKDGTAGTTRATIYAPAGQNAGYMLPVPMTQSAAAANWTATLSAGVSSVYVTAIAVKKTG